MMKKMYFLIPALLLVAVSAFTQATGQPIVYVDSSVAIGGNGSSWANAYKSLATALNAANSNTSVQQVLVARGTYYPTPTTNVDTAFVLARGGIKIYGGYPSGGAGARNITANPVVLSGDISPTDRDSYHVMVIAGIPSNADSLVLDGLTIAKGSSYLNSAPYVEDRNYNGVTIRTVTGSGIVLQANASTKTAIRNCLFSENRSAQYGGGIYCKNASLPIISNCSFINNYSGINGGAIYTYQSTTTAIITNCNFSGNTSYSDGGGMYNWEAPSTVTGCTFTGNDAFDGSGGGMYNFVSMVIVTSCRFVGNTGFNSGGGIFNIDCAPAITNSVFVNNKVNGGDGGGVCNTRSSSPIINCIFYGNSCARNGGAVSNRQSASTNIVNSTFSANTAGTISGGSDLGGTIAFSEGSITVANSIVWGNDGGHPGIYNNSTSAPATVRNSIVQGTGVYSGTGNLNTNPLFLNAANPAGADGLFATADDGLQLQGNSPAINAGNNADVAATGVTTDLTGATRIQDGRVDMGAYEYTPTCLVARVYVDSSRATSGNGQSWANAYKTLTEALNIANNCSAIQEIYMAKGTYYPTASANRDSSFRILRNNIGLYGGYPSGGGTTMDYSANPTILSGNIGNLSSTADNSYHVMMIVATAASPIDETTIVDGFTFTGGNANGTGALNILGQPTYQNIGGGLYNYGQNPGNSCKPLILNCIFTRNTAADRGAGMFNEGYNGGNSSPFVFNSLFTANTVTGYNSESGGGAMYNNSPMSGNSSPSISSCTMYGNTVTQGRAGGIFNNSSAGSGGAGTGLPIISNCLIWGNTANNNPGIYNFSGANPTVSYSLVQGGYPGTANLNMDPLFVDAAGGNLQLQSCSPAINNGSGGSSIFSPEDIGGNPRVVNSTIDIGAYEYQGIADGTSLAINGDDSTYSIKGGTNALLARNCRIVARILPNGSSPVGGSLSSRIWIDAAQSTYNGTTYVKRHYQFTPATNAASATARITLYATQSELNDFNAVSNTDLPAGPSDATGIANLRIFKFSGQSSDGTGTPISYPQPGTEINPDDNDIVWSSSRNRWEITFDVTGFSGFFISNAGSTILPLTLVDFTAQPAGNKVILNWHTSAEVNTSEFVIERSGDGAASWKTTGTVAAKGLGNGNYALTDWTPLKGRNYYRLKMLDKDGQFHYSPVRMVDMEAGSKADFVLMPNPAVHQTTLYFSKPMAAATVIVYDAEGRLIQQQKLNSNSSNYQLNTSALAAGNYTISVINGSERFNQKLVVIR